MLNTRTLEAFLKARGWTRAELARRVDVSRQAVSLWFREQEANLQSRHLMRLAEVLGVPAEDLAKPLPCFEPQTRASLRATLLWDRLYPDLDDFAVALNAAIVQGKGIGFPVAALWFTERRWPQSHIAGNSNADLLRSPLAIGDNNLSEVRPCA